MVHRINRPLSSAVAAVALVALIVVVIAVATGSGGGRAAVAATGTTPDTVTVSGTGMVRGVPDTLTATFDVHTNRGSVQDALNAAGSAARRVISSLRQHGLAGPDIQTSQLSIDQYYDNKGRPTGYECDETITARIHPLSHVGRTLQAAATSAGNAVRLQDLSFDITDNSSLLAAARQDGFTRAKSAATQYATLANRSLGGVTSVKEAVSDNQPDGYKDLLSAGAAGAHVPAAVPIRAGQQPVTVLVTVTWALR